MLRQIVCLATCWPLTPEKAVHITLASMHAGNVSSLSFILTNSCSENQSNLCPELKPPVARDLKRDPPEEARGLDRFL